MTATIRAVISDLDGTLVDTRAANEAAYLEAFGRSGVAVDSDDYRAAFGLRFVELAERLAPGLDGARRDRVKADKALLYPSYFHLLRRNDGLVALLTSMSAAGTPIALATTASRVNVDAVLAAVGLTGLFPVIVAGEDVEQGKPAPDCYLQAAARLGEPPDGCLAFEDSEVGLAAALAAGCAVMAVRM